MAHEFNRPRLDKAAIYYQMKRLGLIQPTQKPSNRYVFEDIEQDAQRDTSQGIALPQNSD